MIALREKPVEPETADPRIKCGGELWMDEASVLERKLATAESALAVLKAELEQEKMWKVEDPRMLREQIRVADVAFNHLHEEHAALKLKLEVALRENQSLKEKLCQ